MYRINSLGRPVLITPDEVMFHAAVDKEMDARTILQSIIVAEERIIAPAMSDAFYYEFIKAKNLKITSANQAAQLVIVNASRTANGLEPITLAQIPVGCYVNAIEYVTNTDYVELWEFFLHKLTAEAVDLMTVVPSWLRTTAAGQQKNNPEVIGGSAGGSVTGDKKDVQFKLDILMQDRIDPLTERMHLWICNRKSSYPLYNKKCDCDNPDGVAYKRKTDWVFLSNDEDENCKPCSQITPGNNGNNNNIDAILLE